MEKQNKKRIRLVIADNVFTVLSSEDEAYSKRLAAKVDASIKEICQGNKTSVTAAAILTALNCCDSLQKNKSGTNELRHQLVGYLEEINKQQDINEKLRLENKKLRQQNELYRSRLKQEYPLPNDAPPVKRKK